MSPLDEIIDIYCSSLYSAFLICHSFSHPLLFLIFFLFKYQNGVIFLAFYGIPIVAITSSLIYYFQHSVAAFMS